MSHELRTPLNAIKYTEQGSVAISVRPADGKVLTDVRDTGIGIETEQMQRLFIPFERLDFFLRLRTSGTGLGLYLTRKIAVDLLSGDVSVVSTPGAGSCFHPEDCRSSGSEITAEALEAKKSQQWPIRRTFPRQPIFRLRKL
ncbi:ATP-binding protein [Methylomicrobium sp. RS1]|uniref:ATP-binding protein n=1 Tax=Candidatus Methylomicrobium oryzae TaxID=2802053 RepID=UPI001924295E|nr:ATP-binding protein [Methylomicrobium sp. RS1]MBL1265297.1 hypothetical protein [Methylomicrobium sp. RS1]